ncbi:pantothenate transporter, putative [Talaromyces stipitatus ATCC 10500]|uniref:Pantothenate transporter, putative n=1 Tax=Talaromyces stipitatus (strain ATCC 10500 / CBS 375.48 / QM 6759 / NRRL 1006) TaxID=441959 RepID=B8MI21_TALSN|nr:pantothenate transporter, putative [Talaromyces stipitatus ATCC 10500]EED17183.1 pantothenate transporter, putative [Talaromyces stipitatus ATCC 10500]
MGSEIDSEAAVQKTAISTWSPEASPVESTKSAGGDINTPHNIFSNPKILEYYTELYEKANYECRHLLDPSLEWTRKEERKLVRKLDWHVCLWACTMFFALQVDRGNLKQAISDNMLQDLKLSTNDYNYGNTIFLVSFLLAELPSQLVSKKLGPDRWIPMQMTLWSIVAISQVALNSRSTFYATRALLGVLEGGFIPDVVLWLSYFYTSHELPIRLSFFWTSLSITGMLTSLLAFAIFHLDGIHGISGWRYLFLIEGLITLGVGIASFFLMPASAVQTNTWFRPKGWFSDRELSIVVNRILRDDPSKGDMHNRMAITPKRLWLSLTDYDLWPIYALGLIAYVPQGPVAYYLTLSLRHIGFNAFQTNLLTIPATVAGIITLLGITWLSERFRERTFISMMQSIWTLPCIIALRFWPGELQGPWGTFALITVLLSYPYCHAILVAWCSKNSGSVRTRSVSAAVYNMMVQLGGVISSNIYRADDAPLYHKGNTSLIIINALVIMLFVLTKVYYITRNKWKAKRLAAMSEEEKVNYVKATTDQGNKRLDFVFAH